MKLPALFGALAGALLHVELVFVAADGEAPLRAAVTQSFRVVVVDPELVALGPMTGVEDDVAARKVEAGLVAPYLAGLGQHPVLVAALVVAGPQPDGLVHVLPLCWRVDALVGPGVLDLAGGNGLPRDEKFRIDRVQVPLEGLALQVLAQFLPTADVTVVAEVVPDSIVVVVLVVVQPDLRKADGVAPQHVDSGPPLVGRSLSKDMADMGAGHDLEGAPAHPGLERQLKVLAAPDVEP